VHSEFIHKYGTQASITVAAEPLCKFPSTRSETSVIETIVATVNLITEESYFLPDKFWCQK